MQTLKYETSKQCPEKSMVNKKYGLEKVWSIQEKNRKINKKLKTIYKENKPQKHTKKAPQPKQRPQTKKNKSSKIEQR